MVGRELEGLFCEVKERKIWTFIVGVMVIRRILFSWQSGQQKKLLQIFFLKNQRKLCHVR
jgi:hypothetical protein